MNTTARRVAFRPNWPARAGWLLLAAYCVFAVTSLEITWSRFVSGLGNGVDFFASMIPPNFARWELLVKNLIETLEIAVIASAFGVAFSLPIGLAAARNLMPAWATWPARAVIAVCRSFHPAIFAILFVKAVGFGPLAGILTLIFASIGFIGKLFAEAIEEISLKPVEALQGCGRAFHERHHLRRAAAGPEPVHRLRHIPVRREPAQFDHGRHRRGRRHRRHPVRRIPAFRL
jgi:phosphonate transport system permease protein